MKSIEYALRVVEQWDKHDKFRVTEADKVLWDGEEPGDVAMAREFIYLQALLKRLMAETRPYCRPAMVNYDVFPAFKEAVDILSK